MKSYNFKYNLETRAKLREVQETLEVEKGSATINDALVYCISIAHAKIKEDEKNNLFPSDTSA